MFCMTCWYETACMALAMAYKIMKERLLKIVWHSIRLINQTVLINKLIVPDFDVKQKFAQQFHLLVKIERNKHEIWVSNKYFIKLSISVTKVKVMFTIYSTFSKLL